MKKINKKIHVVHIIPTLNIGGAEKFVMELCKNISNDSIKQSVIILWDEKPFATELPKNIDLKIIDFKKNGRLKRLRVMVNYLKLIKADVVHTHLFSADVWGRLAAFFVRVPIVTTEHNLNFDESKLWIFVKRMMKNFSKIYTAPSLSVANFMKDNYRISLEKIKVIYHGIEVERFLKVTDVKFIKPYKLAIVGRIVEQKGHRVAIEALQYLEDVKLIITGKGDLKESLQKYAITLKVAEKIEWKESTTKIVDVYSQADIVLVPSLWEGLGLVVLEAMCSNRLVIASAVDGILEIVKDRKTGRLFAKGNAKELAYIIQESIDKKEKSLFISQEARKWTTKNCKIEDMAKKYENIYLNLFTK